MKWRHWMSLYLETYCTARGLRPKTIAAYDMTLQMFRAYVRFRLQDKDPAAITTKDVLEYVGHLRGERANGDHAVNRQVTVLRSFYRAMVAMDQLEPRDNPLAHFPTMRPGPRKLPDTLSQEETRRLIAAPRTDTILGLRDRAILVLLYGTGIRASECADLRECDLDLGARTIRVAGKGGYERAVPLNDEVVRVVEQYRRARGPVGPARRIFRSRLGRGMSRNAIYERVRTNARRARLTRRVSPHRLRHTFATELIRAGTQLVVVSELLGHQRPESTNVYIHLTARDLRDAIQHHPVTGLVNCVGEVLPQVRLPMQCPPGQRFAS